MARLQVVAAVALLALGVLTFVPSRAAAAKACSCSVTCPNGTCNCSIEAAGARCNCHCVSGAPHCNCDP